MNKLRSHFWRGTWGVFVYATAPMWIPMLGFGGALAALATHEVDLEAIRKMAREVSDA